MSDTDVRLGLSLNSYNDIRDRLRVRVMDYESNKKKLENLVYIQASGGFALVPYMILDDMQDGAVANITKTMAQAMCIDGFTIIKNALDESVKRNPPVLRSISSILNGNPTTRNLLDKAGPENKLPNNALASGMEFLVLTNEDSILGASVLYYPDVMRTVSDVVGGDYYVVPSSIHEVLIMPANAAITPYELLTMVRDVNSSVVDDNDELATRVLLYDAKTLDLRTIAE